MRYGARHGVAAWAVDGRAHGVAILFGLLALLIQCFTVQAHLPDSGAAVFSGIITAAPTHRMSDRKAPGRKRPARDDPAKCPFCQALFGTATIAPDTFLPHIFAAAFSAWVLPAWPVARLVPTRLGWRGRAPPRV